MSSCSLRNCVFVSLVLVFAVISGCTYKYTKAFYTPECLPDRDVNLRTLPVGSYLNEDFGDWRVWASAVSTLGSKNAAEVAGNMYQCGIAFRLPEDFGKSHEEISKSALDTLSNVIIVDSLLVEFLPLSESKTLFPISTRNTANRLFGFYYGNVHVPPEVEAMSLKFTARLVSADDVEIMRKEYDVYLVRWEYKRNVWTEGFFD